MRLCTPRSAQSGSGGATLSPTPQGLAGHEDSVLLVIQGSGGPEESQTDAAWVLRGDVLEETERLEDPGSGTCFKQHLL